MTDFVQPKGPLLRLMNLALRLYLCLVLAGCASKQRTPTVEEIRQLETRVVAADYSTLFDASVSYLQDLGFTVEVLDTDAGVITAGKQSEEKLDNLFPGMDLDKGMPVWAIILLVITGIIIIAGIIVIVAGLSGDDDDDEKSKTGTKDEGKDQDDIKRPRTLGEVAVAEEESKTTRSKEEIDSEEEGDSRRSRDSSDVVVTEEENEPTRSKGESDEKERGADPRARDKDAASHFHPESDNGSVGTTVGIAADILFSESGEIEYYDYRIMVTLNPIDDSTTSIRTNAQVSKMKGREVLKTGSVYDARFFDGFYNGLVNILAPEPETAEPEPAGPEAVENP